jgi:hypothetical protein
MGVIAGFAIAAGCCILGLFLSAKEKDDGQETGEKEIPHDKE